MIAERNEIIRSRFSCYWEGVRLSIIHRLDGLSSLEELIDRRGFNQTRLGLSYRVANGRLVAHCYNKLDKS